MTSFKQRVLHGDTVLGTWSNLDSSVVTEIIGLCGYDWVLLDTEHRPSTTEGLLHQLQSLSSFSTTPIVRVPWLDRVAVKWALDIGAAGIMFPSIETVEEAKEAVSFMRYSPNGVRGVSGGIRAAGYGFTFADYFKDCDEKILTIIQIETQAGLDNVPALARVDGVDILFVGPVDLSVNINKPRRFEDQSFMQVLQNVAVEARKAGKPVGILLPQTKLIEAIHNMGYSFIAVSSDTGALTSGLAATFTQMQACLV